jgi:hypothetical protein
MKSLKILHLPNPVGGNSYGLSRGERLLGLQSDVLVAKASWLDYPADINLHLDKLSNNPAKFLRLINTFLKIRNKYDIFHFNFGSTLFHDFKNRLCLAEIPFYPRKTRLFATYNGCDARQKYPTVDRTKYSACKDENCYQGICNSGELDKFKKKSIQKMSRYVKHIWAVNPDLLYYLPQEKSSFLPYTVAYNCDTITPPNIKKRLKILHAPTNRAAKGSDRIISTLSKLSDKYKGSI